jgi:peptidoglycan hydrolase CwlO-like protein
MNTSNSPDAVPEYQAPRKNSKNTIIAVLAIAFIGTWGYLLIHNNSTGHVIDQNQAQIAKVTDERSDIRKSFDQSLIRLDSMSGINVALKGKLASSNSEISKRKSEIRYILNKKNATAAELAKAKDLIAGLNDKISTMEADVARLSHDNEGLTQDKVVLTQEKQQLDSNLTVTTAVKQDLEKKVDVASTLNASNIAITPVSVKSNGKEKVTTTAKHVNKLLISFDVNNRIAQPGLTDVFVCITGPDGKSIITQATGSGTFTTREEGEKPFTAKLPVDVETAKSKNVEFAFSPGANFQQGNYTIQIYQNGFKIGEGTRELKKGGLFS